MKRTLQLMCIGMLAGGLLTGCPNKDGEKPATATQTTAPPPQTTAPPQTAAQTAAQEAPVDAENYNQALFQVTCVRAKITDTEEQKAIIDEVYARYGFDAESFGKAQEQMKDKADVTAALTAKMETCTEELAKGFKEGAAAGTNAGTTGKEEADEGKKEGDTAKKPAKKWKSGAYTDNGITGGKLDKGQLRMKINDDGKVSGRFQGTREGKGFSIPFTGEMQKDGKFNAQGSRGPNNARVSGRYKSGQVQGAIQGTINKQGFRVSYVAK